MYAGKAAEDSEVGDAHGFAPCRRGSSEAECPRLGTMLQTMRSSLEPLLQKYAVDVYAAGHIHHYSSMWPLCNGAVCGGEKSFQNPKGTVFLTEGNGGVPTGELHRLAVPSACLRSCS